MFYERQHIAFIDCESLQTYCNVDDIITVERNIYGAWCIRATEGRASERQYYYYTLREAVELYAELYFLKLSDSWADGIDGDLLDCCDDYDEEEAE